MNFWPNLSLTNIVTKGITWKDEEEEEEEEEEKRGRRRRRRRKGEVEWR